MNIAGAKELHVLGRPEVRAGIKYEDAYDNDQVFMVMRTYTFCGLLPSEAKK